MKKDLLRKLSSIVATAMLAGSLLIHAPVANAATVNDLTSSSNYARDAIQWMAGNNVISGDTQGNFYPKKSISRAELVTLMVKALGVDVSNLPSQATFSDVPTTHWAFKYVEAAARAGIVSGIGNGKFGANNTCTREQIPAMIMNYLSVSKEAVLAVQGLSGLEKFKDEGAMSGWAKPSIQFALSNNIMSGVSSDEFSPAGSAKKEQIAVILYKFLNSQETINQSAEAMRKPLVSFNGDVSILTSSPKLMNGEMYLSLQVLEKIGLEVIADELLNKVTIKRSASASDPATFDNMLQKSENELYLPMQTVVDALGMQAEWNEKTNLLTIKDSNSVNNPMLFNAMKSLLDYKGEYISNMALNLIDNIYGEDFNMDYTMNGAINGLDSTSDTELVVSMTGVPDEEYSFNTVAIGNTVYDKDQDTGEWSAYTKTEADEYGIIYTDVASERASTQKMLDAYNQIKINNFGKATLNGLDVTKYKLTMNKELLESLLPEEALSGGMGIGDLYNNGMDYSVEMYVNSQGQMVKQFAKFTGGMEQEDMRIGVTVTVITEYLNIGKSIEIVNPLQ